MNNSKSIVIGILRVQFKWARHRFVGNESTDYTYHFVIELFFNKDTQSIMQYVYINPC